jgi:hypothetical protein
MRSVPVIIRRYVEAYNAMDVEAMLACLSSDVRFVNRTGGAVTHETSGIDSFRVLAEQGVQLFVERKQSILDCISIEDRAALRIAYRAIVRQDLPNGWNAGQAIETNGISFFAIDGVKITEVIDAS